MNKTGPVVIIEDDLDDQYLLELVFKKLNYPNKVLYFSDGEEALRFLTVTDVMPFLILSDINMPKLNGFELRSKIHTDAMLQLRCIPYLFFSTSLSQEAVINAYGISAQGFFLKPHKIAELEETISIIMEYWYKCTAPNDFQAAVPSSLLNSNS